MDIVLISSIIINSCVFLLSIGLTIFIIKKIKVEDNGYKLLFVFYTIFWIPLMLLRNYTAPMHGAIGGIDKGITLWLPMAAYGFIGIFWRPLNDIFAWLFRSRKAVIYLALGIELVTLIPIIVNPCLTTNIIQSVGVGIGASCIGMYQLFFSEQYNKKQVFLTVSILSVPPLLGDFISSPLQSVVVSFCPDGNNPDPNIMKYMWVIGVVFVVIAGAVGYFVKEKRECLYVDDKYKQKIQTKSEWRIFVLVIIVGMLLSFIKFANSGSIAQLQLNRLADGIINTKSFQAYLSVIFSVFQLIGGLITGLFLVRKIGSLATFSIGCGCWIIYQILAGFVLDPFAFMAYHSLNGLSYGIVYNLVLANILKTYFAKTNKATPMGIYQSFLSLGVCASGWFTGWLKGPVFSDSKGDWEKFKQVNLIVDLVVIGAIVVLWLFFLWYWFLEKRLVPDRSNKRYAVQ